MARWLGLCWLLVAVVLPAIVVVGQDLVLVRGEEGEEASIETVRVSNKDVFVPTNEWQEVMPGQSIPRGLHVRIDMQTGKKEARILQPEVEEDSSKAEAERLGGAPASGERGEAVDKPASGEDQDNMDPESLKRALKNIKADFVEGSGTVKGKFRSIDQLKEEFKGVDMAVKTDVEVMKGLMARFNSSPSSSLNTGEEERLDILESLEYYVHQYDNGVDFIKLGGLDSIILPSLNSSSPRLKATGCFLLGSAAQSNPQVQISILEEGLIQHLTLITSTESSTAVAAKAFYALSAVLRNFPEAQNTFLRNAGLSAIKKVFDRQGGEYHNLKMKILTLLNDLAIERTTASTDSPQEELRKEQYSRVDYDGLLADGGWCEVLQDMLVLPKHDRKSRRDDLVSVLDEEQPPRVEHDTLEKVLNAMLALKHICHQAFTSSQELQGKMGWLEEFYNELATREQIAGEGEGEEYFSQILHTLHNLGYSRSSWREEL